jgi:hypothetical protein
MSYFKGTMTYSSVNGMMCKINTYRDDLESLAYVLYFAKFGKLPWHVHRKNPDISKHA